MLFDPRPDHIIPLTAAIDNRVASRLGQLARQAGKDRKDVGDDIDRGLILRRLMEEAGYGIVKLQRKDARGESTGD